MRWLRGSGGTKYFIRPPLRSWSAPEGEEAWSAPGRLKSDQVYSILRRTRADFSKPPQPIVALVPKVGSPGEHRVAEAAKPIRAWDASVTGRQKAFGVFPGRFKLCRANAHPTVKSAGLAVLVRSAGPTTQKVGAGAVSYTHLTLPTILRV